MAALFCQMSCGPNPQAYSEICWTSKIELFVFNHYFALFILSKIFDWVVNMAIKQYHSFIGKRVETENSLSIFVAELVMRKAKN